LDKDVSDGTPRAGAIVVYTLTLNNTGPEPASGVVLSDTLPAGVTYVSDDGGGSYASGTGVWSAGDLDVGASASLRVTATVDADAPGRVITNTAVVSDSTPIDVNESNDRGAAAIAVQATDAVIGAFTPVAGGTLTYVTSSGYTVTVEMGPGVLTESVTLVLTPLDLPSHDTAPFSFAGHAFTLDAYVGASLLSGYEFGTPISLTIHYGDEDVVGIDEAALMLYVLTGDGWEDACCGDYERHPDQNWLTAQICHLSEFSLLGRGRRIPVGGVTLAARPSSGFSPGILIVILALVAAGAAIVAAERKRRRGNTGIWRSP
jgi:uncharacterized repeat protein (TIGR01451 family)